jgi:hypothetical protein
MQAENSGRKFAILGIGQPRVARDFLQTYKIKRENKMV